LSGSEEYYDTKLWGEIWQYGSNFPDQKQSRDLGRRYIQLSKDRWLTRAFENSTDFVRLKQKAIYFFGEM
jgi:hypothetical protein